MLIHENIIFTRSEEAPRVYPSVVPYPYPYPVVPYHVTPGQGGGGGLQATVCENSCSVGGDFKFSLITGVTQLYNCTSRVPQRDYNKS